MKTILIIGAIGLLLWMIRGNWQDEDPDGAAGALLLFVGLVLFVGAALPGLL